MKLQLPTAQTCAPGASSMHLNICVGADTDRANLEHISRQLQAEDLYAPQAPAYILCLSQDCCN